MSAQSPEKRLRVFLSAGEPSGDLHAANLIRAIRRLAPAAEFAALGGDAMEAAGASLMHNMLGRFAVMGFADALRVLPAIRRLRNETIQALDVWRPDAAVLVDYPGFNLNLALHLKRLDIPVYYYICPQIWAWAPWRVRKIRRRVDGALVVFPFEKDFYARRGMQVEYVGHPLGDEFAQVALDEDFIASGPLSGRAFLMALLPGSRSAEIERGLPVKVAAANLIKAARPEVTFAIPVTNDAHAGLARRIAADGGLECDVFVRKTHEVMRLAKFAIATSGTATLELAHFGVPMIVLYRTNPAGLLLKRLLVTTPHIALVNIVAGRTVVPEMVYCRNHAERIAATALDIMSSPQRLEAAGAEVRAVGAMIDAPGASLAAARLIVEAVRSRPAADAKTP